MLERNQTNNDANDGVFFYAHKSTFHSSHPRSFSFCMHFVWILHKVYTLNNAKIIFVQCALSVFFSRSFLEIAFFSVSRRKRSYGILSMRCRRSWLHNDDDDGDGNHQNIRVVQTIQWINISLQCGSRLPNASLQPKSENKKKRGTWIELWLVRLFYSVSQMARILWWLMSIFLREYFAVMMDPSAK